MHNDLLCYMNVKSSKDMIVFFSTPEPDEDAGDFLLLGETSPGNMDNLSHRIRVNYNNLSMIRPNFLQDAGLSV